MINNNYNQIKSSVQINEFVFFNRKKNIHQIL